MISDDETALEDSLKPLAQTTLDDHTLVATRKNGWYRKVFQDVDRLKTGGLHIRQVCSVV